MNRDRVVLIAAAAALVVSMAAIGGLPSPHTRIVSFLTLYSVAFVVYLFAARTVLRAASCARGIPVFIVAVSALAHAAVIPARPDLSTDVYRYAWEGRVILDGHDPFTVSPQDTALAHLRNADYGQIGHPNLPTIYPPLAQGVFAVAALVHPGVTMLKIIFSLFNLGTVWLLFRWLRLRGRAEAHALVFAWNPLVIVETGHSGHVDAMAAFFLVLALYLWQSERRVWSGLVLGASVLVKYVALAAVPWFVRRRHFVVVAVMVLVLAVGYVPFLSAGARLFTSLREYSAHWWFNGPPYMALSGFLGSADVARRLLAAGGIAFAIAAAHRERDFARYAFLVLGCILFVSPTVYPWYLMWILPLLCLFPSRAWIAFSGLVMLSYGVWNVYAESGAWVVPTWLLALEYAPFYILLLAGLARANRRKWAPA